MTDLMKKLLDTKRHENLFLTPIQQMLLKGTEFEDGRRHDVIHPSELVAADFCDLALYYRLSGWEIPQEGNHWQLEVIFAQGHGYHAKYQNWAWEVGLQDNPPWRLRGRYFCVACGHRWEDSSPAMCPVCQAKREALRYREVKVALPEHNIHGSSDGDLDLGSKVPIEQHPLLEIKSVGEGTIRFAAPNLIGKHTKTVTIGDEEKKWTDWQGVWRGIRRPFQAHLKQGALYCLGVGRERMIYVYEFKPTGAVKTFEVKPDFDLVAEALETALDIQWAVKKRRPPDCPHGGCKKCQAYEELRDGARDEEEEGSEDREDPGAGAGEGPAEAEGNPPAAAPGGEHPRGAARSRRRLRRGSDGGTARAHGVGESSRRGTRARGGDGGERTDDLRADEDGDDAAPRTRLQGRDDDRAKGSRRVVRRGARG